ncbi:MAG: Caulobacter phage CcrPW [Bacteroidota bacterium]|jgi:hypothetical protein
MGVFKLFSDYPLTDSKIPVPNNNPNPYRYKIVKYQKVNVACVVMINYPDCTNYEGNKILVYKSHVEFQKLKKKGIIDPHFFEKDISPIARFEPTEFGWDLAMQFAKNSFGG